MLEKIKAFIDPIVRWIANPPVSVMATVHTLTALGAILMFVLATVSHDPTEGVAWLVVTVLSLGQVLKMLETKGLND